MKKIFPTSVDMYRYGLLLHYTDSVERNENNKHTSSLHNFVSLSFSRWVDTLPIKILFAIVQELTTAFTELKARYRGGNKKEIYEALRSFCGLYIHSDQLCFVLLTNNEIGKFFCYEILDLYRNLKDSPSNVKQCTLELLHCILDKGLLFSDANTHREIEISLYRGVIDSISPILPDLNNCHEVQQKGKNGEIYPTLEFEDLFKKNKYLIEKLRSSLKNQHDKV